MGSGRAQPWYLLPTIPCCCCGLEALRCGPGGTLFPASFGSAGLAVLSWSRAVQGEIRQSIPPQGMGCDCLLEGEGKGGGEQPILL